MLVGGDDLDTVAAEAGRHGAATVFTAADAFAVAAARSPHRRAGRARAHARATTPSCSRTRCSRPTSPPGSPPASTPGINWDLVDLEVRDGQPVGRQPMLQDSVLAEVGWRSSQRVALFRPGSFEAVRVRHRARTRDRVADASRSASTRTAARVVEQSRRVDEGPSLADADVIVAGGIGLGSPEGFELAEQLAAALNGAVGATRAAVYKGWYPPSSQIGQTGTTVSPKLYVALGISGAVQHKVGMQSSKTIVAVNKDPNAPIFEFSDLAVVGDVHTVVPELVELLRKHAG